MAKLSVKSSTTKPLPPFIRQRLTLQSALLTNPQKYIKNVRFDVYKERVIPERECPPKPLVSERTQTRDVMDAETNTKTRLSSLESKTSRLMMKCVTLAKEARLVSRSPYAELARWIKRDGHIAQKGPLANSSDSKKELPGIKRRRGILKKVLEDVEIEGMCSQGTATEGKRPPLERILKENHLYLKYSKSCKPKKKRVRMEKHPAFSYFTRRPESVQSLAASEEERPTKVGLEDDEDSADSGKESLERKPARLALPPSGDTDAASESRLSVRVSDMASAPQLNKLSTSEKLPRPPRPSQITEPDDFERAHDSPKPQKKPPCRVPRDRLCFKNVFSHLPGMCRR